MREMEFDPAFQMVTEDEARALRIAVTFALRSGIATEGFDSDDPLSNRSLVSLGRKLGCKIPDWCDDREPDAAPR